LNFSADDWLAEQFANAIRGPEDLHVWQRDPGVKFLLDHPFSALFVDMGLGKTVMTLSALAELHAQGAFRKALIIAPLRVANLTWPAEIRGWRQSVPLTFAHIRDEEIAEIIRKAKRIAKEEADISGLPLNQMKDHIRKVRIRTSRKEIAAAAARNPADVHIINREQVEFLANAWGKRWPYDTVIIDESSSFKSHDSLRFRALKMVRPYITRMHQLTATPASESHMGLFAQTFLLDQGERFGRSITAFREKYFQQSPYTRAWKILPGAAEEIAQKISDIVLVMKADDYLPRDKPTIIPRVVRMSKEQTKAYKNFERSFFLDLPTGEEIEAKTAPGLRQKLLQLASGAVYGDGRKVHWVHDEKIEEVRQIAEENNGLPLMIAYWYKPSLARLKAAFPDAVEMDKAGAAEKPWNAGKISKLLVHPASSGHGLNLQQGPGHIITFFDIPDSLELWDQIIGRLNRQGQKRPVRVFPIITEGTLDEFQLPRLQEKEGAQDALFQRLKALRRLAIQTSLQ
jgi:hypothetical protein